jgi:hypothetical protein
MITISGKPAQLNNINGLFEARISGGICKNTRILWRVKIKIRGFLPFHD